MLYLKDLHTHRFTAPGHKVSIEVLHSSLIAYSQDRVVSNILTDSLLLREITEELKRNTADPVTVTNNETAEKEDGYSFQSVLKYATVLPCIVQAIMYDIV